MVDSPAGTDPRLAMDEDALDAANRRAAPQVRIASGFSPGLAVGILGVGALALLTYGTLANSRMNAAKQRATTSAYTPPRPASGPNAALTPVKPSTVPPPVVPPGATKPIAVNPPRSNYVPPLQTPRPPSSTLNMPIIPAQGLSAAAKALDARLQSPAVVVDLTKGTTAAQTPAPGDAAAATAQAGAQGSADDRFSARLAGEDSTPSKAKRLANMSDVVPQGAVMSGVLETAINSDLPGYVRAVVSTDVTGFDGRKILIPKGSRLIGQYRSGLAAGEKRAFVIWQRVMRPDGVSVQLTSPGTDTLGRAGLAGKVDTHFFRRFGSAVLLSVIDGGLGALATAGRGSSGTVVISSAGQARNVAGSVLEKDLQISPTVKVAQGTSVRIFIARDLDFSGIGGVPLK